MNRKEAELRQISGNWGGKGGKITQLKLRLLKKELVK